MEKFSGMLKDVPTTLLVMVVLVFLYPIIVRIFLELAQPSRLKMATLGKKLLGSNKLTEPQKELIRDMLDDAFDWRYMLYAVGILPFVAMKMLVSRQGSETHNFGYKDLLTNEIFKEFSDLHLRATAAANPLLALLFVIELAVILAIVIIFVGISVWPKLLLKMTVKVSPNVQDSICRT